MKGRKGYVSIFTKSVIAFLALGFLPFIVISLAVFRRNINAVTESAINSSYQVTRGISKDIEDLLKDVGEYSKYLYEYESDDYGYFYEIVSDSMLSDILKQNLIEDALKTILYRSESIRHVYFISAGNQLYSSTRAPEKIVSQPVMTAWVETQISAGKNAVTIIPTHSSSYYLNSAEECFTYTRNIMNTRSIQSAGSERLGTLFIDLSSEGIRHMIDEAGLSNNNHIFVIDQTVGSLVYSNYDQTETSDDFEKMRKVRNNNEQYFCLRASQMYFIGYGMKSAPWAVVEVLPFSNLERTYNSMIKNTSYLVLVSILLLTLLYQFYAKTTGRPIRILKNAMDEIKAGNLQIRVDLRTNDELGIMGNGLNSMAEQLQKHIETVYVSEIRQKEAQISALMAQIQPHYLYNTLDTIRMSAIINDDRDTAIMLESLSAQMRYLISDTRSLVSLKEELDSIQDYFNLIRIRYENSVRLEINASSESLKCKLPRLTLQPIIENSVKYGISPKGEGTIAVYSEVKQDVLEITVIDDGAGMDEGALAYVNAILRGDIIPTKQREDKSSIGLRNIEERIKLQFGENYGIDLSSTPGIGTLVRCRIPVSYGEGGMA